MIEAVAQVKPLYAGAAAAVVLLLILLFAIWNAVAAERLRRHRFAMALGDARRSGAVAARQGGDPDRARRKKIEATLKELSNRQKATQGHKQRLSLRSRLRQSGLDWSYGEYAMVSLAAGAFAFFVSVGFLGTPYAVAGLIAVACGLMVPHLFVNLQRSRRLSAMLKELPDALDVIVRGVRSGLPLGDCLRLIAVEGREPLRSEMRLFVEDIALGLTVEEAGARLHDRAPLLEMKLLGIILNIQNKAGGNLSEAVGNLSRVLRDRRKMQAKVRAMSTEATASAAIIAALPVLVCTILYFVSPDYISLLFETKLGNFLLGGCLVWMLMGVLVMRGMINFEV